jgi:hypothetical protein
MTKSVVVIILALAALITGLLGAWKWYRSSEVKLDLGHYYPGAPPTYSRMGIEFPRGVASGDPDLERMNEIAAIWEAMSEAGPLNKHAALWTAASVALGALCAVIGTL